MQSSQDTVTAPERLKDDPVSDDRDSLRRLARPTRYALKTFQTQHSDVRWMLVFV